MTRLFVAAALMVSVARAATAGQVTLKIDPVPKAGDCTIGVILPQGTSPDGVVITLDSDKAPLDIRIVQRMPFVGALKQPLLAKSDVIVQAGGASAKARVLDAPGEIPATCPGAMNNQVFDEREVFEASGFLGQVFDSFAPLISNGIDDQKAKEYVNPQAASTRRNRVTTGVEAQYRVWGRQNDVRQIWLGGYVLHGLRTADAQCSDSPTNADCLRAEALKPADSFVYILGHASTIEAHVNARFELFRIQSDSAIPAKLYIYGRAGFLDIEDAPQVFDTDSVGIGLLAPKGAFRNSYAQAGWGISHQFATDQKFDRFKINGVLVFDIFPNLSPSNIWKQIGSGTRFFLAIAIDRNFDKGPDAVQTYIGFDFDLRRVFGAF